MKSAIAMYRCPSCGANNTASVTYKRTFSPNGTDIEVELLTSRCESCLAMFTTAAQHVENLSRLKARKEHYGNLLLGEEIFALRRHYGLTQQNAAVIFGKGKIAFSRYENESSYPDQTTTKLLRLAIREPEVIKMLADEAGIVLPMWNARCNVESKSKVRHIQSSVRSDKEPTRSTKALVYRNVRTETANRDVLKGDFKAPWTGTSKFQQRRVTPQTLAGQRIVGVDNTGTNSVPAEELDGRAIAA